MARVLIFAGTTEGRQLAQWLLARGAQVAASVATGYGKSLLPAGVEGFARPMDAGEMAAFLRAHPFDCVVDATHPYADRATENIRAACAETGVPCLRLLRPPQAAEGGRHVATHAQAVALLAGTQGNILVTTGSKDLEEYTRLPDYRQRVYPRILPTVESVSHCLKLGFPVGHLIAMQGPFSRELNLALLRQVEAAFLVTKDSGAAGGFLEKLEAARQAGATAVIVGRPSREEGLSTEQIRQVLQQRYL